MNESEKRAAQLFEAIVQQEIGHGTWVRHYLYVDHADDAKLLMKDFAKEGVKLKVTQSAPGEQWHVLVIHRISGEEGSIENYRALLEAAVEKIDGARYDGWDTEIS